MYDPQQLLNLIDANAWYVLIGFGIDSVFQIWWLGNAVRVAERDRAYSIPLVCTYFWFAHDFSVVVRFQDWFVVYDHWYLKFFWFVLLAANTLECFYLWQVVRYGRKELLPQCGKHSFVILLLVGLLFAQITYEFFRYGFGDPLFQLDPTLTMLAYPAFGAALLIRRRSARGQSATMWWTFSAMTAGFHLITGCWYGDAFRSWQFISAGVAASIGGIAMAVTVSSSCWRWNGLDFDGEAGGRVEASP